MSLTINSNYRRMKLEKSVKSKTMDFLSKLDDSDAIPGLHVEPINNSADKRFRSGRVDDFYRAALFRIDSKQGVIWVVYGVYPHDEVIDIARKVKLSVNPVNGVTEVEHVEAAGGVGVDAGGGIGAAGSTADADDWQNADWARNQAAYEHAAKLVGLDAGPDEGTAGPGIPEKPAEPPTISVTAGPEAATPAPPTSDPVFGDRPLAETLGRITDAQLTGQVGVSGRALAMARGCRTVDELLNAFDSAPEIPEWQVDSFLDLASGTSLIDLLDKLKGVPEEDGPEGQAGSDTAAEAAAATAESQSAAGPGKGAAVAGTASPVSSEDDALAAGLRTPAAQLSFAEIQGEDELKAVIQDGDFAAWRVFLHPEQRRYVQGGYRGPFRLKGGAGTGKTIVLVHRAVRLAKQEHDAGTEPRVVLTTYTTNLADQLDEQVALLDLNVARADKLGEPGLHVSGIDKLVSAVLRGVSKKQLARAAETVLGSPRTNVTKMRFSSGDDKIWNDVLAGATAELPDRARNPQFLAEEYEQVVLPARIVSADGYKKVRRPNRSVRMSRQQRAAVWEVFEAFRTRSLVDGAVSWEEARQVAAVVLEQHAAEDDQPGKSEEDRRLAYPADHVLVDEGQDLKPGHWKFLRALVRPGRDDLFIAEDAHQRIYGSKVVLSRFGINIVGRSRSLSLNYRTTEAILRLGLRILSGGKYTDAEDVATSKAGYRSLRAGVEPVVKGFANRDEEFAAVASAVRGWLEAASGNDALRPEENAILVRTKTEVNEVQRRLGELGVSVNTAANDSAQAGKPLVMTMHRAKGTEFRNVVIMHVGAGSLPPSWALEQAPEDMREDKLLQERSLLYVAATRARDQLMVTYTGERSELLG